MPLWARRLRCHESVWYHPTQIREAWIPPPSNHQATVGSIFVCQRMGLIYRFCQSSPFYLPETEKQVATTWPGQHQICQQQLKVWEGKLTVNMRDKNLSIRIHPCPASSTKIYRKKIQFTIQTWNVMKAQRTFAYQKICSAFQTAYAHVTVAWSASGTHKAQEIKAVNKGPSDKGSPDSYESRAGRGLATGSFRTRADGHEKTNHSDEHEGHHLHLALPIHTDFHLCSSASAAVIYPLIYFFLSGLVSFFFFLSFLFSPGYSCISHWTHLP